MSFIEIDARSTNKAYITQDGNYRIRLGRPASCVGAEWESINITPFGLLKFSKDGDEGTGGNTIDLGAGKRVLPWNMRLDCLDVAVSNFPTGGGITLAFL